MRNENKVRLAHELLDEINARQDLTPEQTEVLRSFLPELPKQMALKEILEEVESAACSVTDSYWSPSLNPQDWLWELHAQLKGIKDVPATAPALPAGMRLADHEKYGRVVVSPGLNDFGLYLIFVLDSDYKEGAHWHCEHGRTLTFIDAEPAHPEFLETEADYNAAPEGTIVARDNGLPWVKEKSNYWTRPDAAKSDYGMSLWSRRILRWGNE